MDKPINFTGLWKRTSKNGLEYLSASCSVDDLIKLLQQIKTAKVNVMAFKNKQRDGRKDPDWQISLGEFQEREQLPHVTSHAQPSTEPPAPDDHGF